MKKVFIFTLVFICSASIVLAQNQQGEGSNGNPGNGNLEDQNIDQEIRDRNEVELMRQAQNTNALVSPEDQATSTEQNDSDDSDSNGAKKNNQARNEAELHDLIQQKQEEMNQEMTKMKASEQKIYKNQNQVRLAVHALLASEDLLGGIGQEVSAIAREFNNSIQSSLNAEEKIQNRSALAKIFIGGNKEAANSLAGIVAQNQERIEQLTQLEQICPCDLAIKNILQDKINDLTQEQNRLQQLIQAEQKNRGIFGWLFGWFKK